MKHLRMGIFVVLCLACLGTVFLSVNASPLHTVTLVSPNGSELIAHVEWATTEAEQQRGLMDRTQLDHGMLFLFSSSQSLTFWMKNTLIPLDIVFFDDHGSFVSASQMTPCTADPCQTYSSGGPAQYALEMPAGFIASHQIGESWSMRP